MVINGGYSSDSTWTTADGETFGILPPMPLGLHDHCLASLDDDGLFVTGFHNYNTKTFLYHSDTMQWEQIQNMPTESYTPACAMVHNSAGEQEVVVVTNQETYIFNLQGRQWRKGESIKLPHVLMAFTDHLIINQFQEMSCLMNWNTI